MTAARRERARREGHHRLITWPRSARLRELARCVRRNRRKSACRIVAEPAPLPPHLHRHGNVFPCAGAEPFGRTLALTAESEKKSKEDYIALMRGLRLPNPKQMDIAVPANLACGAA